MSRPATFRLVGPLVSPLAASRAHGQLRPAESQNGRGAAGRGGNLQGCVAKLLAAAAAARMAGRGQEAQPMREARA